MFILTTFQSQNLDLNGADVWFLFDGERVPAHQSRLKISEWFNTMFLKRMVQNELDMTDTGIKAKNFKEFLKFFYEEEPHLNLKNIEGILDLAKKSSVVNFLELCEDFLIDLIFTNKDQTFFAYQLASRYDANRLGMYCEFQIEMHTGEFQSFIYHMVRYLLQCEAFGCGEKTIVNALLLWAKTVSKRKNQDPSEAKKLRDQLQELVYQIRYTPMTATDLADCLKRCRDLVSVDDMIEILHIIGRSSESQTRIFSDLERNLKLRYKVLECSRLSFYLNERYDFKKVETTKFQCSRSILFRGFNCVCDQEVSVPVTVIIKETEDDKILIERSKQQFNLIFGTISNIVHSHEVCCRLKKPVLLKPNTTYQIEITFENDPQSVAGGFYSHRKLKSITRPDPKTEFKFHGISGIVSRIWFTHVHVDNNVSGICHYIGFYIEQFVHQLLSVSDDMTVFFQIVCNGTLPLIFSSTINKLSFGFCGIENPWNKKLARLLNRLFCMSFFLYFIVALIIGLIESPILVTFLWIITWFFLAYRKMHFPFFLPPCY